MSIKNKIQLLKIVKKYQETDTIKTQKYSFKWPELIQWHYITLHYIHYIFPVNYFRIFENYNLKMRLENNQHSMTSLYYHRVIWISSFLSLLRSVLLRAT